MENRKRSRDVGFNISVQFTYSQCHEDKDSHSMLASMINYILVHRKNKELKAPTFRRMNEVECLFHSTPQVKLSK